MAYLKDKYKKLTTKGKYRKVSITGKYKKKI